MGRARSTYDNVKTTRYVYEVCIIRRLWVLPRSMLYFASCVLRSRVKDRKAFLQVRGTLCKCCSMSQQRSSPGLGAQVNGAVSLDRTRLVNTTFSHDFSWLWQRTLHILVVEVAGPRDICQAIFTARFPIGVLHQLFEVVLDHYRTLRANQRRRSKASGFRKQCHEGNTTSSHLVTPLV